MEAKNRVVISSEQVLQHFRQKGLTISDWAKENGFSQALVYAVINGKRKCLRGQSSRIALALGIK